MENTIYEKWKLNRGESVDKRQNRFDTTEDLGGAGDIYTAWKNKRENVPTDDTAERKEEIISAPKKKSLNELKTQEYFKNVAAPFRDWLRKSVPAIGETLFGKSEGDFLGEVVTPGEEGIKAMAQRKGIISGLFYSNLLKSETEKISEDYNQLVKKGFSPERATRAAEQYNIGNKALISPAEKSILSTKHNVDTFYSFLELLDAAPILKRANKLTNPFITEIWDKINKAENAFEVRKSVTESLPELIGTKELETVVSAAEEIKSKPELLNDFIREAMSTGERAKVIPETPAQKIVYQNGIPTIQRISGKVEEGAVSMWQNITKALRGESEAVRLSQPDILASEIRAGSVPFETAADDIIEVSVLSRRGGVGAQVTPIKELAEEGAKKFRAKVRDLVRLPDGTFAYAPEAQVAKDLSASLKMVRKEVQPVIKKTEQLRIAGQKAERRAEGLARKAQAEKAVAEKEAARIAEEARVARIDEAKRAAEEARGIGKTEIASLERRIEQIAGTESKVGEIAKTQKLVAKEHETARALKQVIKDRGELSAKKIAQKLKNVLTVAEKKKLLEKGLTEFEFRRIAKRIKGMRDKNISTLKDTINALQNESREARAELKRLGEIKERGTRAEKLLAEARPAEVVVERTRPAEVVVEKAGAKKTAAGAKPIEPVKGGKVKAERKITESAMKEYERILADAGGDVSKLPKEYSVAGNREQLAKAAKMVIDDEVGTFNRYMSGEFADDTLRTTIGIALKHSDYVTKSPERTLALLTRYVKEGTRIAQELQARNAFSATDEVQILQRIFSAREGLIKKNASVFEKEMTRLKQEIGEAVAKMKTADTDDVHDLIDVLTCK